MKTQSELEKIEELKDILDLFVELDGEEVLEGEFGKRLLEEISILEERSK